MLHSVFSTPPLSQNPAPGAFFLCLLSSTIITGKRAGEKDEGTPSDRAPVKVKLPDGLLAFLRRHGARNVGEEGWGVVKSAAVNRWLVGWLAGRLDWTAVNNYR